MPGTNLTRDEAATRAAHLDVTSYVIDLDLTAATAEGVTTFGSTTTISFTCHQPGSETFADLVDATVSEITLNGQALDPATAYADSRIALPNLQARSYRRERLNQLLRAGSQRTRKGAVTALPGIDASNRDLRFGARVGWLSRRLGCVTSVGDGAALALRDVSVGAEAGTVGERSSDSRGWLCRRNLASRRFPAPGRASRRTRRTWRPARAVRGSASRSSAGRCTPRARPPGPASIHPSLAPPHRPHPDRDAPGPRASRR